MMTAKKSGNGVPPGDVINAALFAIERGARELPASAVPEELAYSDSDRIEVARGDMTLVVPPALVGAEGALRRRPALGERRVYDVRVDSAYASMWATWTTVVMETSASSYELAADLDVHSMSLDAAEEHLVADVTAELSTRYSLVVAAGGYPTNVFAIEHRHEVAEHVFTCCIAALAGLRGPEGATVRLALTALGC